MQSIDDTKRTPANRGTGAGGAQTTKNGAAFELVSAHTAALDTYAFVPITFRWGRSRTVYAGLRHTTADGHITVVRQHHAVAYMKHTFKIHIGYRPDELYIVDNGTGQYEFKILEKKSQNTGGSVIDKLEIGATRREIYRRVLGSRFRVEFAWCVNTYLKTEILKPSAKNTHFRDILAEQGIQILFANDAEYPVRLHRWIFAAGV